MKNRAVLLWCGCLLGVVALGCGSSGDPTTPEGSNVPNVQRTASSTRGSGAESAPLDATLPRVIVHTNHGDITIELDAEKAPLTVDNFLDYVDRGHYDGTIFHQVVAGYVILGGGYTEDLQEKPAAAPIRNEADNGLKNTRGTVAMARRPDAADSSTCQFFINLSDNPHLDYAGRTPEEYGYCVFGRVVQGMDVVDRIGKVPVEDRQVPAAQAGQPPEIFELVPVQSVRIESIRRLR
jgi:cyclophilin family peptidyl-prolyl cis-trans isomerase